MKKSFAFSAIGSLIIIAFFFTLNFTTSWSHPWFIYPTFVVLWWPLSMFFVSNRNFKAFSIAASILTTAFFFLVNMITSSSFPWFIFPTFLVWWWPLSMFIAKRGKYKLFSVVSSLYTIAFLVIVNLVTANVIWFIYPAFAILWWPISHIICGAKRYKLYSIISSIYFIAFLALVNYITSPGYAWFYYPAYAIIWWPMSMFLLKKKSIKAYSLIMMLLTIAYLAVINLLNTPSYMWFQYTIFYLMWWPLVMFLGEKVKTVTFSVIGAAIIIMYHVMIHYLVTPLEHPWYLYLVLPAVWWPVSMALRRHIHRVWFLLMSILVTVLYYGALNIFISSGHFWSVYIIYPALWAVLGMYFGNRREYLTLSIVGAILTIVFFVIVNYITTPNIIWAIYPSFAILWWPLSLYFYRERRNNKQQKIKKEEA